MACVWMEGFETHRQASQFARKYATFSGNFAAAAGRVFGFSGNISSTVAVTPTFTSDNTFVLGFGFRFNAYSSVNANQGLFIETGSNEQCRIEIDEHSSLGFRFLLMRGSSTIIATSSYFDYGVWHYFEWKLTVRTGTNGVYELRRNGVLDISGSSVNLADNATDGWDTFAWRYSQNLGTNFRYDDVYVLNGIGTTNIDFLGPSVIEGVLPTANGTTIQWTPSSGANYTTVDDIATSAPDDIGAGGYNGSDTNAQQDLYAYADLAQITGTIHAVQVGSQLAMGAAGTRTVKTKYRDPDTTVVDGATHVVDSTTYDEFTETFDLNPNSSAAWDVADIDDGQFGIEVVS